MKPATANILMLVLTTILSGVAFGQSKRQLREVTINGQSGQAEVIDENGRLFVDVLTLANISKGSISFSGPAIRINFPALASDNTADLMAAPGPSHSSALSQEFMKNGIEEIAGLREWATTLGAAIRGGYGVTDDWVNGYRDQASKNLQLADASASTDGDHNAAQLLHRAFELVQQWSDQLVAAKKSMSTAKYATSPNALRDHPLSQKLINCEHFMTQMLGSATFQDNGSCS